MSDPKSIRLIIVDDSELVRLGLATLLEAADGIAVVGEAGTVADAVSVAEKLKPDLVMLDLRLPDGTGFDACREILRRLPGTRILTLTSVSDEDHVDEAIRAGSHGYFLKEVHGDALIQAVRDVAGGKSVLDPVITAQVLSRMRAQGRQARSALDHLTLQDRKMLALLADGKTNKEIGTELGLAEKTIKNQLTVLFEKLGINRRSQAAAFYVQNFGDQMRP
ncbi:MAG: response regulator transcription factor [Verrucomicrobiota bacterium]